MSESAAKVPEIGETGYARIDNDNYRTPPWVTKALVDRVRLRGPIWECACGQGDMAAALEAAGLRVAATDLFDYGYLKPFQAWDFLDLPPLFGDEPWSIVTNPPNKLADQFIARALEFTQLVDGMVAMLLPLEFDSANGRRGIFEDCPAFACKITLTKRIRWIGLGDKASPRKNHAWFLWDHRKHDLAPPVMRWGP